MEGNVLTDVAILSDWFILVFVVRFRCFNF